MAAGRVLAAQRFGVRDRDVADIDEPEVEVRDERELAPQQVADDRGRRPDVRADVERPERKRSLSGSASTRFQAAFSASVFASG
jgi:hypothetical protein